MYNKNASEPMWFRGVSASMGLCLDLGAVLEGHPDVILAVNGDVIDHRQPVCFPKLRQRLPALQVLQVGFDMVLSDHALGNQIGYLGVSSLGLIESGHQSTEASNAIEGIVTTSTRIRHLVEEKTTPRNRDEQEIAGYCDVLSIIHESFDAIPITQNYILQLHKILYSHMNNPLAGRTKAMQNYITATYPDGHVETLFTPPAPYETPEALDRICEEYNRVIGNMELEPLIAIPVFIHDFLCIHPFNDGNGRMSRLLTTLLLYRNGFYVGKYISLEAKIAKNKDLYYDALAQAQTGWHEGTEDVVPFIKYLLGTILAAYKDFEDRMALVETKLPALEMVRRASKNKIGRFNKQDIRELCPTLSDSSIEGALRKLVAVGELKKEWKGKNTCYFRLN